MLRNQRQHPPRRCRLGSCGLCAFLGRESWECVGRGFGLRVGLDCRGQSVLGLAVIRWRRVGLPYRKGAVVGSCRLRTPHTSSTLHSHSDPRACSRSFGTNQSVPQNIARASVAGHPSSSLAQDNCETFRDQNGLVSHVLVLRRWFQSVICHRAESILDCEIRSHWGPRVANGCCGCGAEDDRP
ncbi:hypothetical protein T440DRAFT_7762 [Plenodomus tracheiphilus IPT5]|uniref:Uncharacterized protein n=1 Tax=Plenodomus tracheiphilus IPT5 TaxID=1408161 RepID=A0A6A7BQ95_9PLEO|nr:hypothetical protein T440DRAFT_7762 [Plenodomus tracheiphilus IPT5]